MAFVFPEEFVLFDLEYTAWEGSQAHNWSKSSEYREIIQIGALRVSNSDFSEMDSFLEYVQPIKNPMLSKFITELTGITQKDVETKGIPFSQAFEKFSKFIGLTPAYCWGSDIEVLEENALLASAVVTLPPEQFINLRPLMADDFSKKRIDIEGYTSGTLIQAFGKQTTRRAHDALNDMRNLLDAIHELRQL